MFDVPQFSLFSATCFTQYLDIANSTAYSLFFLSNIFHMILWMLSFDFEHQNFVATNELFSIGSSLCFRFTSFWDIKFYFYFGRLSLSLVNRWPLVCVSFNWMFRFSKHITLLRLPRYLMRIHNTKCYSLFSLFLFLI